MQGARQPGSTKTPRWVWGLVAGVILLPFIIFGLLALGASRNNGERVAASEVSGMDPAPTNEALPDPSQGHPGDVEGEVQEPPIPVPSDPEVSQPDPNGVMWLSRDGRVAPVCPHCQQMIWLQVLPTDGTMMRHPQCGGEYVFRAKTCTSCNGSGEVACNDDNLYQATVAGAHAFGHIMASLIKYACNGSGKKREECRNCTKGVVRYIVSNGVEKADWINDFSWGQGKKGRLLKVYPATEQSAEKREYACGECTAGARPTNKTCWACEGTGKVRCFTCKGRGKLGIYEL